MTRYRKANAVWFVGILFGRRYLQIGCGDYSRVWGW